MVSLARPVYVGCSGSERAESEWPSMSIIPLQSTCLVGVVVSLVIN